MQLQIITPEKVLFEGAASMVTAPGAEGEFGVLDGHAPLVSLLKAGTISVERSGATPLRFSVEDGVAEVTPEAFIILSGTAKPEA